MENRGGVRLYISTSRKPSVLAKRLCKTLAGLVPNSISENRGKKSTEEVMERARQLGQQRVLLVYEDHGNPKRLVFADANEWSWISPELQIGKIEVNETMKKGNAHGISIHGEKAETIEGLMGIENDPDAECVLNADKNEISFSYSGVELIKIYVSYMECRC